MWFKAAGFEGRFEVTNCGRIRSIDRMVPNWPKGERPVKGRELKCVKDKSGYKRVDTRSRGKAHSKGKSVLLHRIIAQTFIKNPNEYKEVNHIDGDKLNNNILNLEWCTKEYNHKHAWESGLCDKQKRPVVSHSNGLGVWYPYMRKVIEDGFNPSLVHAAINGSQKTHGKMKWSYCPTITNIQNLKINRWNNG